MDKYLSTILKVTLTLFFFIMSFFVLIVGKNFLYPLALAMLLTYLLTPAVNFFEKKMKFPRLLAIFLTIIIGLALITGIGKIILIQVKVFITDFPEIKDQALTNINSLQIFIADTFGYSIEIQKDWVQLQLSDFLETSNAFFKNVLKSMTGTLGRMIFIPIFMFFMLFYRDRGREFFLKASKNNTKFTEELLDEVSKVTVKYMLGVLTVVAILAVSHSVALSIIGVKYAIFLGIMAATISVIPYFGTIASTVIPLSFSLILADNPYEPMWIVIYFLFINFIENNILTPKITGGNVHLNPLVTILGLILGATIWGIPGMIIVIPVLGVIKVICDNVPKLEPYGYILGIDNRPGRFNELREKIAKKKKKEQNN
ncbi:MAG: AI-2E family transporter [Bacteroidota bacterium]|nr:AI-2E family transporter [Bacteroidota bacterium]